MEFGRELASRLTNHFGYYFNKVGELRSVDNDERFPYAIQDGNPEDGRRFRAVREAVTEYVYHLLMTKYALEKVTIPVRVKVGEPEAAFFISENAFCKDAVLMLINGGGSGKLGQWSRSIVINHGLDEGSQLSYIEFAYKLDFGVVLLNIDPKRSYISVSGVPKKVALYIWDNFIAKCGEKPIVVVAHGLGGNVVSDLSNDREEFRKRVLAIAFIHSCHSPESLSKESKRLFEERSVNWVTSQKELDTVLPDTEQPNCRSAGHTSPLWTPYSARKAIFRYILKTRQELTKLTEFPKTLKEFGYYFCEGQLLSIEDDERFVYEAKKNDPEYNKKRYEALGEVITEYVYDLLEKDGRLIRFSIPDIPAFYQPRGFFFMSPAVSAEKTVLMIINGGGAVRAGQWNRELIINHGLDEGSQLPYIEFGHKLDLGIIVLNTNLNKASEVGSTSDEAIQGSETPLKHALYVWDNFISISRARYIAVVANGYGGVVTAHLSNERDEFRKRVFAIAFIDSEHDSEGLSRETKTLFESVSVNWVASSEDLDTILPDRECSKCRSAGHESPEWTPYTARKPIFRYLLGEYKTLVKNRVVGAKYLPNIRLAPFPDALKDLGYYFDELDDLRSIFDETPFTYEEDDDDPGYNQKKYEALRKVIRERVYYFLVNEVGLRKDTIPVDWKDKEPTGFWFCWPGSFEADAILMLIHGAGEERAGQWSLSLITSNGLDEGSQLPYIAFGQKRKLGIVVLNTNQNKASEVGAENEGYIRGSESPEAHALYVWDKVIGKTGEKPILVVAHGYGGTVTAHLLNERPEFRKRVLAIALVDSKHDCTKLSEEAKRVFAERSINWVPSSENLNAMLPDREGSKCRSAGHKLSEWTPYSARKSIFRYLIREQHKSVKASNAKTVESFGYYFNTIGELRSIDGNQRFSFIEKGTDHDFNQKRYEELGKAVTEYVYESLEHDIGLDRVTIPVDAKSTEPKGFFFMSPSALTKETMLIIISGSGAERAGQWSLPLIINKGLDEGSQLAYIRFGLELSLGIVVLNTNLNTSKAAASGEEKPIRGSDTAEAHAAYVWDNFIENSKAKHIVVVAHSYGGVVTGHLSNERGEFRKRVFAIAFTDSVHEGSWLSDETKRLFAETSVNWVASRAPLDTVLPDRECSKCRSAGHRLHEWTSYAARKSVFRYIAGELRSVLGESVLLPYEMPHPVTLKHTTLKDLGCFFSKEGKLIFISTGCDPKSDLEENIHRKLLRQAIAGHVYQLLEKRGLEKYTIPIDARLDERTCFIFLSPGALEMKTILLLVGVTNAGVWDHSIITEVGLNEGTQLSYVEFGNKQGYGVVIPNLCSDETTNNNKKPIRGCETPLDHAFYVWDNVIEKSGIENIAVVAYGDGGLIVSQLAEQRDEFRRRVFAIAFVESEQLCYKISEKTKNFLAKRSVNWVARMRPFNVEVPNVGCSEYRSSGNISPNLSVSAAKKPIFDYIIEEFMKLSGGAKSIFPETLEDFGYHFNSDGELRSLYSNRRFKYLVQDNDPEYNALRYEAIAAVIDEYIYCLLEQHAGLERVTVPIDPDVDEPRGFFFMSPGALEGDTILLLINGAGTELAGQWCRWSIISRGLNVGSQLPYIEFGQNQGYGIVILNTNQNMVKVPGSDQPRHIRGSAMPEEHALYLWDHFIKESGVKHIAIVAHGYGGFVALYLAKKRVEFPKRVFAAAFIEYNWTPTSVLIKPVINWVTSGHPVDTPVWLNPDMEYRSGGTNVCGLVNYSAQNAIFDYITEQHMIRLAGRSQSTVRKRLGIGFCDFEEKLELAGLEMVTVPVNREDEPKEYFFKLPRAFKKQRILLIISGESADKARYATDSAKVDPFMTYVKFSKTQEFGLVVLHKNGNKASDSESLESLAFYVWDNFIATSGVRHIAIVAIGFGGVVAKLLSDRRGDFRKLVFTIVLVNYLHATDGHTKSPRDLFPKLGVKWIYDTEQSLETKLDRQVKYFPYYGQHIYIEHSKIPETVCRYISREYMLLKNAVETGDLIRSIVQVLRRNHSH